MTIGDLLTPEHVILSLRVAGKGQLLDDLARRASGPAGISAEIIAEALGARERLGSTGTGAGIAIPHARLTALKRPLSFFARLRPSIDFAAIDNQKVDLVFLLLLPAEAHGDHLNALACVARRLRADEVKSALRKLNDVERAYDVLTGRERI